LPYFRKSLIVYLYQTAEGSMTIYLSFDVETTGPVPGLHSMVSFGAVALRSGKWELVGTIGSSIALLPDAGWDVDTEAWWYQPSLDQARQATFGPLKRGEADQPGPAMLRICAWLEDLAKEHDGEPLVFVACPAVFDFAFLNYYMHRFCARRWTRLRKLQPNTSISYSCLDMKSLAVALLGPQGADRKNWPESWLASHLPITHEALDDARSQGFTFVQMMQLLGARADLSEDARCSA
jgi:hypothetical protein